MSSTTKRRTRRPQRSTAEQVAGKEEQRRTAWRDVERAAQAKGDWQELFRLRDAVGAADLVALFDTALSQLAARLGLEPAPATDGSPIISILRGRPTVWITVLEERTRALGQWAILDQALEELADRLGVTWPTHQVATPNQGTAGPPR